MNDTFMKEKPVLPLILSMSLPMVLSMLVNSLYNIVDSFFVAQISEEAMTALSLVYPVQNFINAVGIGFGVGINAVIAFYLGAGDYEKADQSAHPGACACRDSWRCYDSLLYRRHAGFPADVHCIRSGHCTWRPLFCRCIRLYTHRYRQHGI